MNQSEKEIFQDCEELIDKLEDDINELEKELGKIEQNADADKDVENINKKLENVEQLLEQFLEQWIKIEQQQDELAEEVIRGLPSPSAHLNAWEDFLEELYVLCKKDKRVASAIAYAERMIQVKKMIKEIQRIKELIESGEPQKENDNGPSP